jgi:hypothetical protein
VVELSAVNRSVVGSSPTCGAILESCPRGRRSTIGNRVYGQPRIKGSNPLLSARYILSNFKHWPVGQAVKTPPFHGGNTGSNPVRVTILYITNFILYGGLAQLGEHLPYKQGVGGSNPSSSTINFNTLYHRGVEHGA